MQAALVLLAVAGSTAWLALDASKRDWTDNGFAKNVPSWVVGSLLLWPVIFPLYVFVHRKKAPLLSAPEPVPAVAMAAAGASEQYGPSIDEVEHDEPEPEPVVEIEPELVVEVAPKPVVEIEPGPVVEVAPEPAVEIERESVVAPQAVAEPEPALEVHPEPVVEIERESVVEVAPVEPEPIVTPEPDAPVEPEPAVEPAVEPEPESEPEPVLEISYPDTPVADAPPGLSVDAFKDIKPVAFGGVVVEPSEPETPVAPEPEPQPEPVVEAEPEPIREFEPLTHAGVEDEAEPAIAAAVAVPEPVVAEPVVVADEPKPKKRGFRLPNPELKLPSFGKKKTASDDASAPANAKAKGGLKLPQITLPPNLEGPLTDLERKIALGSVVAIVAAAALGYSTAPVDDAAAPAPTPAPAAASR